MQSDFWIQNNILKDLYKKIQVGQFFHAVIFEGKDAFSAAVSYAAACVCISQTPPCGNCSCCKKAFAQIHPDIYYAKESGTSSSITIDTIRFVREDAYKKPNEAPRKVYIFPSGENMTDSAQNALLKILEEPPANVIFILTCANSHCLLPTVLSRCQLYSLPAEKENSSAFSLAEEFTDKLLKSDEMDYLALSAPFLKDRELFAQMLSAFQELIHMAVIGKTDNVKNFSMAERLNDQLPMERLFQLYDAAESVCKKSENKRIGLNQNLLVSSFFAAAWGIRYGTFK